MKKFDVKKRYVAAVVAFIVFVALSLCGCGESAPQKLIHILIEEDERITVVDNCRAISRGEEARFRIHTAEGYGIVACDYGDYRLESDGGGYLLVLNDVRYSVIVALTIEETSNTASPSDGVRYHANGGYIVDMERDYIDEILYPKHVRVNTNTGERFGKAGFCLIGWNTKSDGSGEHIGLGSKADRGSVLYAEYVRESDVRDFRYREAGGRIYISSYTGSDGNVVIPAEINGKAVVSISARAFKNKTMEKLVLPRTVISVRSGAFENCFVRDCYMTDRLFDISDASFADCEIVHLHINAATAPKYCGTYYQAYTEKYDRLSAIADKKKIVLYSGSSTRFGYDSAEIDRAFDGYEVVNMGVKAYTSSLFQLKVIEPFMNESDVLLVSPEFDAIDMTFFTNNNLDRDTFTLAETNYDIIAALDMREFDCVFDAYAEYISVRSLLPDTDYSVSPNDFDEDWNPCEGPVYNEYGDYILYREDNYAMRKFGVRCAYYNADYFPLEYIESFNAPFRGLRTRGVAVYYTYSPRSNISVSSDSSDATAFALGAYLAEHIEMPIISPISESLMSPLYFYATDNHLSTNGVKLRTEKVIGYLREAMRADGLV